MFKMFNVEVKDRRIEEICNGVEKRKEHAEESPCRLKPPENSSNGGVRACCPSNSALLLPPFLVLSLSLFREHSLGYRKQFQFEKFKYPDQEVGEGVSDRGGQRVRL